MLGNNVRFWIDSVWLVIGLFWLVTALRFKPVARVEGAGTRLQQIFLFLLVAVLLFSQRPLPPFLEVQIVPRSAFASVIGLALAVAGAAVALASRAYLGGNWSASVTIKEGHELIRTGPYAWVRHPIYFGLLISAVGTAMAFGQMRHLMAVPVLIAAFRLKQLKEEQMLVETFGQQYLAYRQAVRSAMIPFVL